MLLALVCLLRWALSDSLAQYPLLLFIPAIFVAALLFDRGTGFFATLAGAVLAAWLFIPPAGSLLVPRQHIVPLALFVLIGFGIAWVTEALRTTIAQLAAAERNKAILLRELAHRTKNDLTIVQSLLTLQARNDPAVAPALQAAAARIHVIARAQSRLEFSDEGEDGGVALRPYLGGLCQDLADLFQDVRSIDVQLSCDELTLDSSKAIAVGLIVNELVTNAFKYAFPQDRGGVVRVTVSAAPEGAVHLAVEDDGVGCPPDAPGGLGTRLVRLLVAQHGGVFRREPKATGCRVVATIP